MYDGSTAAAYCGGCRSTSTRQRTQQSRTPASFDMKRARGGNISSRLELLMTVLAVFCTLSRSSSTAAAFHIRQHQSMSATDAVGGRQPKPKPDAQARCLRAAAAAIPQYAPDDRSDTKKALLETVGYGVMDPVAYQTFESSPLPPKLRPTTHVRVAEGVHSFGQEFMGFPPEEGVSKFSDTATPVSHDTPTIAVDVDDVFEGSAGADGGSYAMSHLHAKLLGVGMRMTVLRLGNGEIMFLSPVAPTVELLDQLKEAFPAIEPTSKVHLVSPSWSPEHWTFIKHWKDIFPAAKVWAVPGPHRRLIGVEVDHDLEHACAVPEALAGEVEVAVLEGVPLVREALLLHRPTGTLLSADLLIAMDKTANNPSDQETQQQQHQQQQQQRDRVQGGKGGPNQPLSATSGDSATSYSSKEKFGEKKLTIAVVSDKTTNKGKGRRLRWRLLARAASLLDMKTLAVLAPFKTVLHAVKGNSADFTARVLSWDTKVFVACHGQSPLEGPELKAMLHGALGRYVKQPSKTKGQQQKKKKRGDILLAFLPGGRGRHTINNDEDAILEDVVLTAKTSQQTAGPGSSRAVGVPAKEDGSLRYSADGSGGDDGDNGDDFWSDAARLGDDASHPTPSTAHLTASLETPNALSKESSDSFPPLQSTSQATSSPERTIQAFIDGTGSTTVVVPDYPAEGFSVSTGGATRTNAAVDESEAQVSVSPPLPQDSNKKDLSTDADATNSSGQDTASTGDVGLDLGAVFMKWGMPKGPPAASKRDDERADNKDPKQRGSTATAAASSPHAEEDTATVIPDTDTAAEIEARARRYVKEKIQAAESKEAADSEGERGGEVHSSSSSEGVVEGPDGSSNGYSGNPFVKDQDSRYDEQPVGPLQDGHDPFEEPFYPFTDNTEPGASPK